MTLTVVSSLIYSKKMRTVMEVIPPRFRKLWKEWDLRLAVLLSLTLQILLIILGRRRKYDPKLWLGFFVWSVYLAADSIATFALGILSNNLTDMHDDDDAAGLLNANTELTALWAPFLLLHLGGPDTITAYSLEDNELWLRHLLGLFVQTIIAFYVFLMAWTGSRLSILFILMFFAGLIKYGERTWVLRSASNEKLRESMFFFSTTNPQISRDDIDLFRRENEVKNDEGYIARPEIIPEVQLPVDISIFFNNNNSISDKDKLCTAYGFVEATTKGLFLDATLSSRDKESSKSVFRNLSFENAFQIIEMELGLMYDLLYTKAPLLYTLQGMIMRLLTFSITCVVLVLFTFLDQKQKYSKIDLSITFVLLGVAIILEIYSALLQLFSDQFSVLLSRHNFPLLVFNYKNPRWSRKMCHLSFLSFSKVLPCHKILKLLTIDKKLEKHWHVACEKVHNNLKEFIFQYLEDKAVETNKIPTAKGEEHELLIDEAPKIEEDLGRSILFWHIVTEISYYLDRGQEGSNKPQFGDNVGNWELIKQISGYMFYLLVVHPSMLSVAVDQNNLQETLSQAADALRTQDISSEYEACEKMVDFFVYKDLLTTDRTLYNALSGSSDLRLKYQDQLVGDKWKKLGCIWLKILAYAASKCKGSRHAEHLRRGGELLTHVWLLMAHFGLTDHFQIPEPHITRLIAT